MSIYSMWSIEKTGEIVEQVTHPGSVIHTGWLMYVVVIKIHDNRIGI